MKTAPLGEVAASKPERALPGNWVGLSGTVPPFVAAFRKEFAVEENRMLTVHVSADERYELYLDGRWIGRGSERGDANNWFYETYELDLSAGAHVLVAKVWALGKFAPSAQISVLPGCLIVFPQDPTDIPLCATVASEWFARELRGFSFDAVPFAFGIGWRESINGLEYTGDYRNGSGEGWKPVRPMRICRTGDPVLTPAMLPPMWNRPMELPRPVHITDLPYGPLESASAFPLGDGPEEDTRWHTPSDHDPLTIPAKTLRRFVFRMDDYYCIYPEIRLASGRGTRIRIQFAESAFLKKDPVPNVHFRHRKGNRDELDGKYFLHTIGSTFLASGSLDGLFDPLWWFAGRYIELLVETADEPLELRGISLLETRYPRREGARWNCSDPQMNRVLELCLRSLQMCSHETFLDCPFYEQLMYVGDARLQALTTYVSDPDCLLPAKAIRMFHASRRPDRLTKACHPYRGDHCIPPFSLLWIGMLADYALWQSEDILKGSAMDHARDIASYFLSRKSADGLVIPSPKRMFGHFNFIDWADGWKNDFGVPGGDGELNSVFNWLLVCALLQMADLERACGQRERAVAVHREAEYLSAAIIERFWDEERGMFSDDMKTFSEHAQCLAILSGMLPKPMAKRVAQGLFESADLVRATVYFAHYYFEACAITGRIDRMEDKLGLWRELLPSGFRTVPESPLPTRSDCHGWGAHPLYHYFATTLGIRPDAHGFRSVVIRPQLGSLEMAEGFMRHPNGGRIVAKIRREDEGLDCNVELPSRIYGKLVSPDGSVQKLHPGRNRVRAVSDFTTSI